MRVRGCSGVKQWIPVCAAFGRRRESHLVMQLTGLLLLLHVIHPHAHNAGPATKAGGPARPPPATDPVDDSHSHPATGSRPGLQQQQQVTRPEPLAI